MLFQAFHVPSLGTKLDANTFRVAVDLRDGAPVCESIVCRCGANAITPSLYSLACMFSADRLARADELNVVVKRTLQTFGVPYQLEPPGLSRDDSRKSDEITMFAYKHVKPLC